MGDVKNYRLQETDYIKLFFDEERQVIGVSKNAEKTTPGALRLNVRENNAYVTAIRFLDHYKIDRTVTSTGLLNQEETEVGELLTVSLGTMKKRKPRARKEPLF